VLDLKFTALANVEILAAQRHVAGAHQWHALAVVALDALVLNLWLFLQVLLLDCRGHVLGRLASIVAKELLNGQKVVLTRCEEIAITGKIVRNKYMFMAFLRKRKNINPTKGPIHYRAPSRIMWRTIRGMIPHKTTRGAQALERLKVFDGVPAPYDVLKRMVIPDALVSTRLGQGRKTTNLGRMSSEVGWKYWDLVKDLEAKRKEKSAAYYAKKKSLEAIKEKAAKSVSGNAAVKKANSILEQFGY